MRRRRKLEFKDLPKYGDHMTWEDFVSSCEDGMLTDDDGAAELATLTQVSNVEVSPAQALRDSYERPDWATHVVWYNQ